MMLMVWKSKYCSLLWLDATLDSTQTTGITEPRSAWRCTVVSLMVRRYQHKCLYVNKCNDVINTSLKSYKYNCWCMPSMQVCNSILDSGEWNRVCQKSNTSEFWLAPAPVLQVALCLWVWRTDWSRTIRSRPAPEPPAGLVVPGTHLSLASIYRERSTPGKLWYDDSTHQH